MNKLFVALFLVLACPLAAAAEFKKEQDCVVGAKVTNRQNKTGTVVSVSGGMCRIKPDAGTGKIVFESGPLAKANAKLLPGPKIGLNMTGGSFFNTTCSLKK